MGLFCNFESIFNAKKVANKLTICTFADIILSISLRKAIELLHFKCYRISINIY